MEFFVSVSFFYSRLFFRHPFSQLFYGATRTDTEGLASCASRSDSQIPLSYSMAVFSLNSFAHFKINLTACSLIAFYQTIPSGRIAFRSPYLVRIQKSYGHKSLGNLALHSSKLKGFLTAVYMDLSAFRLFFF